MSGNLDSWLRQHEAEVEARWLEVVEELPAYGALPADESLSCWRSLVEALFADQTKTLAERARRWADREVRERGATPSELISISEGLSLAIRELLPAEGELAWVNGHLDALDAALAHYFAAELERLTVEKFQLETLYEITRELTASLDLGRMLHRTLAEVGAAISAEMGAVFLVDSGAGKVVPETTIDWNGGKIPLSVLPSVWQLGQTDVLLVLGDLQTERIEPWVEMLAGSNVHSLMVAPLVANGAFMGLLAVGSRRRKAFNPVHVRLFRAVLSQIATAIGNAEVYRLITQQAQELGQMLRLQQEEATKSQAILTSIADGVIVNNAEGKTILVNPAAECILDMPADQLLGHDFHALFSVFSAQGREEAVSAMEALLSASVSEVRKAFQMTLEADNRVVHAHLAPVLTQRGDFLGVVMVLRDVTKEVEADRAKSEFVSNVSHELRTPMTAIKGYTDLLHAGTVGSINDEQQRFLRIIKNNAERLTALINDLLDISRVETGRVRFEPRPMQIGEVISDVVNALAGQAETKHLSLTYTVVGGMPDVMGDRDRLNQVVTNLVSNAIRYTPDGGEIEVLAYPVEGAVRVDVRDKGIGISPEDLGRIFERFYRADHPLVQEVGGTGLGLSIVKMFVEMHGGRVWVESEEGKGSTFTCVLPVPARTEEEGPVRRIPPRLMARMRTILVVDDDLDIANLVKMQLEGGGYRVFILGGGGSVVNWVEERRPDLVLLDLILPDMDGADVLQALKENPATSDIPVIVLSIKQDDGSAWDLGAVDYLTKPAECGDLLRSVEKALVWQGRVLIVEDDADTGGLLSAAMRQVGFTPLVAADGYEALTMARRYRPDLILLDLRLPGMDGYEALIHLKRDAVTQIIPIVAMSAHVADSDQERKRLIALGAASFLSKPFSVEDLLGEIEAALQPVASPALL
jgi:PAS domain S-box-containing protein